MSTILDNINEEMEAGGTHVMSIFTEIRGEASDNEQQTIAEQISDMPLLTLRNMVLFPDTAIPVTIERKKSQRLISDVERSHSPLAVVCQKDSDVEEPGINDLYSIGTVAIVIKVFELPDGQTNVILQGKKCARIAEITATEPYLRANLERIDETVPAKNDREFKVLISAIKEVTFRIIRNLGEHGKELGFAIKNIDNDEYLLNFLAANIPFDAEKKQRLLSTHDLKQRAYTLYSYLNTESQFVELKAQIQSRTREDISQQQREHFLQQQIRTIQEELGNGEDDIDELEQRAKKIKWSEAANEHFGKELHKLERLNPQSPDYSTQYSYLDTLLNLPWSTVTTDHFDLEKVERKLNHDHYGLDKVKDRIIEHLAVLKLRGNLKAPILCLYGPPGVGKTSLGKSIAEALGRKYARLSLGGLHDEAEIRGHRRTYIGAMPGRIMAALAKCGTNNPVIVLDEIDKIGQDFKGDPASALLEVLDPEQNSHFHDNYIDIDYDLSNVLFIATANSTQTISQPLLDRMEMIEINGYITEEKIEIARKHLIPKQLEENGFEKREIAFTKPALTQIISDYTRESGVRELEKKIGKVLRKIARLKATNQEFCRNIKPTDLHTYLGAKEYFSDTYEGNDFAGVVTGLAWTQVGGEILFVESSLSPAGKSGEKLTLTGNLGDVMKESAVIALEYIKAHAKSFGIDSDLFDKYNVHIHVPEGAIPKDGPSAGVTMVTSLVSSFTQRKVRDHLAMTGEITLRGKVLPVGGIKEKILAAKRAGITDIIMSRENKRDIDEIKPIYIHGLTFHYVGNIKEVIKAALLPEKVTDALEL